MLTTDIALLSEKFGPMDPSWAVTLTYAIHDYYPNDAQEKINGADSLLDILVLVEHGVPKGRIHSWVYWSQVREMYQESHAITWIHFSETSNSVNQVLEDIFLIPITPL
jgi:hypothetical protein